ncbi:hypothetical protein [Streptomyces sp. NPDC018031]
MRARSFLIAAAALLVAGFGTAPAAAAAPTSAVCLNGLCLPL